MPVTKVQKQETQLSKKIKLFFDSTDHVRTDEYCPVRDVFALTTDKWCLFVIYNLGYSGVLRFGKLKKYIAKISSRMLSITLKRLEGHGIVSRQIYAEVPPRVEYQLTPFGKVLADKMIDLNSWFVDEYYKKK